MLLTQSTNLNTQSNVKISFLKQQLILKHILLENLWNYNFFVSVFLNIFVLLYNWISGILESALSTFAFIDVFFKEKHNSNYLFINFCYITIFPAGINTSWGYTQTVHIRIDLKI